MWMTLGLAAFAADTRFVQGSTLNLRAEPTPRGAVRAILAINEEVDLLSVEGPFARVRTGGEEGWVAAEFLGEVPLTVDEAMRRAELAPAPQERLSWIQRAAAIHPDDRVLAALEGAYAEVGDPEAAMRVARERKWPRALMLVATDGLPQIELSQKDRAASTAAGEPVDPEGFARRFRFSVNSAGWVLPDRGPAVPAQLGGARLEEVSPCDTGWGTVAYVAAGIPFGREALVFTRDEPPASWRTPTPTPSVPREQAEAAAAARLERLEVPRWAPGEVAKEGREEAPDETEIETATWVVPMPDGWFVRVGRGATPGLPEIARWQFADLHVTAAGANELRFEDAYFSFDGEPPEPLSVRDVNGDGELDVVQRYACGRTVTTLAGDDLATTASRCCH